MHPLSLKKPMFKGFHNSVHKRQAGAMHTTQLQANAKLSLACLANNVCLHANNLGTKNIQYVRYNIDPIVYFSSCQLTDQTQNLKTVKEKCACDLK